MNEKTLLLLEFDAVRNQVAKRALSGEAAGIIRREFPLTDPGEAEKLKRLVSEVYERISAGDGEKQEDLPDIGSLFPKLETQGAVLEIDEAYALGLFIVRAGTLKKWLAKAAPNGDRASAQDSLAGLVSELPDCSVPAGAIFRVLDREGKLRDLPELREIKKRIRRIAGDLETIGSRYAGNEETRHMLRSNVPSQRDGRVVLAIKANFRGRIKGIVHEVSSTGQTVFIEPEEVVEKNNELLIERRRLDGEILRILRDLSFRVAAFRQDLEELHRKILRLETIRARARYSYETAGRFAGEAPSGEAPSGALVLRQARHPLLGSKAVPLDFEMDGDIRTVIITGPNTGGKTVALKTAGLFALMNQFGLALPSAAGTFLPVFDGVYADIGDEQSIGQSLSTFSAHMTNIASIIANAGGRSLALLDELGSGTDPEEGGAIAMAILDHLIEKQVRLIVTTHHSVLKNYGYTRKGVENASMEFDGRTLSPTYRIIMGIPGESRAVDIAARNGLPTELVKRAGAYLEEGRSDVSALIAGLKQKHLEMNAAAEAGKAEEFRLREERRQADLKELRLRQKELNLKAGEVGSLRRLLAESRKTLENLVRELREGELNRDKTVKVKEFLSALEAAVEAEAAVLEKEGEDLAEERPRLDTGNSEDHAGLFNGAASGRGRGKKESQTIGPGAEVLAGDYKRRGRVLRPDKKGFWVVEIGSLRMTLPQRDLILLPPSENANKPSVALAELAAAPAPQAELNLRGMRLEEALDKLRRQIDGAVLSGLWEFAVIHGKGDGVLQRGVHEFLKSQPQVEDYYFSRPELGGFGRTEVILKGDKC
jgi:DNA mismatch repair protein MutS2